MDTKKLRQKILDLAIHGKLVPQDPNDEPASVLLERIKAEKERLIKEGKIKRSKKSAKTSDTPHYGNVPFEVPNSWEWCKLGTVNEIARGGSPRPIKDYLTNDASGINWIKIGDTTKDGKYIDSVKERIRPEGVKKSRMVHKGDFLLTNSMSFGRPYILNVDGCIHDGWLVISPIGEAYMSDFLYYLLSSSFAFEQFTNVASGGVVTNLNSDKVADTKFPLPPLAEQKRIVVEIERWFALIDQIEQSQSDLQDTIRQTKSKILDFAIHGKLVPQDPNDEPASELLKRINPEAEITCDNGHYPVGWIDVILGDIFYHNTGKALNSSNKEGVWRNYLTTSNVYWNQFDLSIIKQMPFKDNELEKCTVEKGDLLVCEGGDIGRSAIWNFDYNICIQNHIHRLRPKGDLNVLFYYYVLRFLKEYNLIGGKGIGLLGLSSNELHKIRMPLPPRKEQDRIVLKIEEMFSVLDNLQKALEA